MPQDSTNDDKCIYKLHIKDVITSDNNNWCKM